jgi:carbon-monoxide dehydrogenase medium subunit
MKAAAFDYAKPASVEEAIALKREHGAGARFLAGGQSLLPAMNMRVDRPGILIDLNAIASLCGIEDAGNTIRVGALTRTAELGRSDLIARRLPLLERCVEHIAHPAIRTMGTFGGSLVLADPAAEWPAACLALDASFVVVGPAGERTISVHEFFRGLYANTLAEDELLVRVDLPIQAEGARSVALELARRRGDFAIAGIVAQAVPAGGSSLADVRIAFFGIADRPVRLAAVEQAIAQDGIGGVEAARAALEAGIEFTGDLYHAPATKRHLAGVLLGRAVDALLQDRGLEEQT